MIALIFLILDFEWGIFDLNSIGMVMLLLALILSLTSGLTYFRQFWRQVIQS
jgi:phosphatidylglycerophosphate synthase